MYKRSDTNYTTWTKEELLWELEGVRVLWQHTYDKDYQKRESAIISELEKRDNRVEEAITDM